MPQRRSTRAPAPTIDIRPLRAPELPRVLQAFGGRADTLATNLTQQQIGQMTQLIVWQDGEAIGLASVEWAGPREPSVRSVFPDCAEIHSMQVHDPLRSDGIGSRLLAACEGMAVHRGYPCTGLAVAIDNVHAYALYLRSGYAESGRIEYELPPARLTAEHANGPERMRFLVKSLEMTGAQE